MASDVGRLPGKVAQGAAALVILTGVAVLAGWAFDIPSLKSVVSGWETMKANTALGFVLNGSGLLLLATTDGKRSKALGRLLTACALVTVLLGVLTLLQHLFALDFGIDELLST